MPYKIRKGGKCGVDGFGVYKADTGELVACHKTEKLAKAQFRLLEMMAHREGKSAKYSEDQPRDERGRFGSSGESASSSMPSAISNAKDVISSAENVPQPVKDSYQRGVEKINNHVEKNNYRAASTTALGYYAVAMDRGDRAIAAAFSGIAGAASAQDVSKSFKSAVPPCTVPQGAKQAAERGLKLRAEFNRGGTAVGAGRARQLVRSSQVSPEIARRIYSYFKRHEVDKRAAGFHPGGDGYPSAGLIAWLLWGGDAMFSAVKRWKEQHDS